MRLAIAIALLLPLNACASYPDLAFSTPPAAVQPPTTEVGIALAEAARLQATYATGYKNSAKAADWSQLPIIGAAAAAAWVLLVDHKSAARTVGKIGIGAGAYSAARGQLIGAGMTDAYLAGHAAMTCILAEGSNFDGVAAQAAYDRMDAVLSQVNSDIARVQDLQLAEPRQIGDHAERLRDVRAAGTAAITQAEAAINTALAEEGAFLEAGGKFRIAVSAASVRVASKGRVRPPIDYDQLRTSLAPAKPKPPQSQSDLSDAETIISDLQRATTVLIGRTMTLVGVTRPYRQALVRVAACPDVVR